jgi:hypothetical protein
MINSGSKAIGVCGCQIELPDTFPIDTNENSGNIIHANAPIRLFKKTFYINDTNYKNLGYESFVSFVNEKCSHLIFTLANTLLLNDLDGSKYEKPIEFLNRIDKPVVVFGLGIQAKDINLNAATLPPQAIEFVRILSQKSKLLGVRGKSTKQLLERLCGIKNIHVTGCPSVFSDIKETYQILKNIKNPSGIPSFSGTRYQEEKENLLLQNSIRLKHWLIEPVNKFNHQFWIKVMKGVSNIDDAPYFVKRFINKNSKEEFLDIKNYFETRYQLFRTTREWYRFNKEFVSFSYGTRFHVNMAALISGKPAIWFTHDERTKELTEFMHLPSLDIEDANKLNLNEPLKQDLYEDFFDHYPNLINNFNEYLHANELPTINELIPQN